MTDLNLLLTQIQARFSAGIESAAIKLDELTLDVKAHALLEISLALRDDADFDFKCLVDVCGIDYLHYGLDDWQTTSTTETGFGRGVTTKLEKVGDSKPNRFAVVYHLLSLTKNHRIRLRVNLANEQALIVDSVIDI